MKIRWIIVSLFLLFHVLLVSPPVYSQEITVIPNGIIEKGIEAVVTGDNVRVRTGPSLKHRIITKVNRGTSVVVLERSSKLEVIGGKKNYWYRIKIKSSGKTGWIYGAFLKVSIKNLSNEKQPKVERALPLNKKIPLVPNFIVLENVGTISGFSSRPFVMYGDLDNNGTDEIITVTPSSKRGMYELTGYRYENSSFTEAYKANLFSHGLKKAAVIHSDLLKKSMLIISDDRISQIFIYDSKRKRLKSIYRVNSNFLTLGKLDKDRNYIIYTEKNPHIDNDGTVTYFLTISSLQSRNNRISVSGTRIRYRRPLPIKKLLCFDINKDGKDEIVAEIGGQNHGGGIVAISKEGPELHQIVNSGLITYNGMPFIKMWGKYIDGSPRIIVYTTNPDRYGDVSTEFGFLLFSLETRSLIIENFFRVNKMLDEINNFRSIIPVESKTDKTVAFIADYDKDKMTLYVKRPIFQ